MSRQPESASPTSEQFDQAIEKLEKRLLGKPDDIDVARQLLHHLSIYAPTRHGLGPYTDCQQTLASDCDKNISLNEQLNPSEVIEQYIRRQALVISMGVNPQISITQLFAGKIHTIHGMRANCRLRLELFEKKGVISKLCHDCFKVQILPSNVIALMQIYFIMRGMDLPRDNGRKCMIELREDVAYPYKGYIYCESEEEAKACLENFRQTLKTLEIPNVSCKISHGCSEYGLKYPKFKFSEDGSHQSFERLASWDRTEARFFRKTQAPPGREVERVSNHERLNLVDIFGFRTWLDYAEIIGDDSCKAFRDTPTANIPEPFATRVLRQSQQRKTQMADLRIQTE